MKKKLYILALLISIASSTVFVVAASYPDNNFGQAMKKMHQKHEAKHQAVEEQRLKDEREGRVRHDNRVIPPRPQPQKMSDEDRKLMSELLNKDYSIKKYDIYVEPQPITWKNDPINRDIKSLKKNVVSAKQGGVAMLIPKGVSTSNESNEVYFAFQANGDRAMSPLYLCINYFADDPLNYNDMVFLIDGFEYYFRAESPSRGKLGARMYWEQSCDELSTIDKDLVYALSHCHWARISLKGADGIDHVKLLNKKQLEDFTHSLELYRSMGGTF